MNIDFTIKTYGYSTSVNGYKFEVINDETNETVHTGVAQTPEAADIAADEFIDQYVVQPISVRHRTLELG